jgi:hypothetical protein
LAIEKVSAMSKNGVAELLRRITGESDTGDPLWKRQIAA